MKSGHPVRRIPFVASLVALLALPACSSLNPFADSAARLPELAAFQATGELRVVWQSRVGSAANYTFQPAVAGQAVYAAAHDGTVVRIQDGATTWSANAGKRLSAGVGSNGRIVAVVTTDGELVSLDATSGAQLWRAPVGAEVLAPPAVSDAIVVVRASDGRLIAFDAADGSRRWLYQRTMPALSLRSAAGVVMADRALVAGFPAGKVAGLSAENGGLLWELAVASPRGVTELERITDVAGTPVLWRSEICAVAYQGRIGCFDLANGRPLWSREMSSSVGLARDARFVYVTEDNDAVHGLDAFGGASVWKQDSLRRRGVTRPLAMTAAVVVGDREGVVHALDRETGQFVARLRADDSAIAADPQAFGTDRFVIQTREGGIFALEAR